MKNILALIYIASVASTDFVNFLGDDQEIVCKGENVKWFFENGTEISQTENKYTLGKGENELNLTIHKINPKDVGAYRCRVGKVEIVHNLRTFSKKTHFFL